MNDFNLAMSQARGFLSDPSFESWEGIVDLLSSIKTAVHPMSRYDYEALEQYIQGHMDDDPRWDDESAYIVDLEGYLFEDHLSYIQNLREHHSYRESDFTRGIPWNLQETTYVIDEHGNEEEVHGIVSPDVEYLEPENLLGDFPVIDLFRSGPYSMRPRSLRSVGDSVDERLPIAWMVKVINWVVPTDARGEGLGGFLLKPMVWHEVWGSMIRGPRIIHYGPGLNVGFQKYRALGHFIKPADTAWWVVDELSQRYYGQGDPLYGLNSRWRDCNLLEVEWSGLDRLREEAQKYLEEDPEEDEERFTDEEVQSIIDFVDNIDKENECLSPEYRDDDDDE